MFRLLRLAAHQCYEDWQVRCEDRGSYDHRLPMFQEMMLKLEELDQDKRIEKFLRLENAVERMEGALFTEFQRRYLQPERSR